MQRWDENSKGKIPLERPRLRWEDYVKRYVNELEPNIG